MTLPEIFLDAAELLHEGDYDYCCEAIETAVYWNRSKYLPAKEFLAEWFKPEHLQVMDDPQLYSWWDAYGDREPRIYALLFAALLAEETESNL